MHVSRMTMAHAGVSAGKITQANDYKYEKKICSNEDGMASGFLHLESGNKLAFVTLDGSTRMDKQNKCTATDISTGAAANESPKGVLFCPGFKSSMRGSKAQAISQFCKKHGLEFTSFDYHCHGESSISNRDEDRRELETIGQWKKDAIQILDHVTSAPQQIIVGSSMGAWLMFLICRERKERIGGLVGIAAAPDFTTVLFDQIHRSVHVEPRRNMAKMGYCDLPTEYDTDGSGCYRIYRELLDEAKNHYILTNDKPMGIENIQFNDIPIRLIHGKKDQDIAHKWSERLYHEINGRNKELILLEDGDHRLSKPNEIHVILSALETVLLSSYRESRHPL